MRYTSGRIEAFSDGVIAIAITLLVLEISIPEAKFHELGKAILDQWPSYLAYVTSFLTIGALWLAHHGLFQRIELDGRRMYVVPRSTAEVLAADADIED